MQDLQQNLNAMHKEMYDTAKKNNEAARRRHEKNYGLQAVDFEIVDFVLSKNLTRRDNNLIFYWNDPNLMVATINGWTYAIQKLVAPFAIIPHISRV